MKASAIFVCVVVLGAIFADAYLPCHYHYAAGGVFAILASLARELWYWRLRQR